MNLRMACPASVLHVTPDSGSFFSSFSYSVFLSQFSLSVFVAVGFFLLFIANGFVPLL